MPLKSMLPDVEVPSELLVPDFIIENTAQYGDQIAMLDAESGRKYTFSELSINIKDFASGLLKCGFGKDDILCIYTPNCIEYPIMMYGVMYLGCTVTTANALLTERELKKQISDSQATFICCTQKGLATINKVEESYQKFKKIILIGEEGQPYDTVEKVIEIGQANGPVPMSILEKRRQADRIAIIYSSGTTGLPKGVQHSHIGYLLNFHQLQCAEIQHTAEGDVTLSVLPFFHMWGQLTSIGQCLLWGTTNVVYHRFNIESFILGIKKYKATVLYLVPPIVTAMISHPLSHSTDLSSVKHTISAAAPLRKEQAEAFQQLLPQADVKQGFGMSEAALTLFAPNNAHLPESSGILMPNVEAKIVEIGQESGKELGPMEQGEFWCKTPSLMTGYLNRPEETKQTLDANGWLKTGDIGYYDENGFWYIIDRIKEIINYKGFNVCPAELEGLLLGFPSILDAAVIGVPDKDAVELPRGYVVVKQGCVTTEEDIQKYLNELVAPYKRLRGGIVFVDKIPKSPSGKILRRVLRDALQ